MIISAKEFMMLRVSSKPEEYRRAGLDNAPDEVWMDLIENYPETRVWVARNQTLPRGIQRILALDHDARVREGIARRYPLDYDLYVWLSYDPSEAVREKIILNNNVPLEVLEFMSQNDKSQRLRALALEQTRMRTARNEAKEKAEAQNPAAPSLTRRP